LLVALSLYRATPPKPPQEQTAAGTARPRDSDARFRSKIFAEILSRFILKPISNKEHMHIFPTATYEFVGFLLRILMVREVSWDS